MVSDKSAIDTDFGKSFITIENPLDAVSNLEQLKYVNPVDTKTAPLCSYNLVDEIMKSIALFDQKMAESREKSQLEPEFEVSAYYLDKQIDKFKRCQKLYA